MTYLEAGIEVLKLIHLNGYEAYFVGGIVRDHLLGVKTNDIDIATNALPSQIANIFNVVNKGIKYNCVTVKFEGYEFETTTYRIELSYNDNRHPIYEVATKLSDDLRRRDFTINALAMDENYKIIDMFNGIDDLKNKCIRTVLNPQKRFTEDALRILRACYFASKLGFDIEPQTLYAMKQCGHLVQNLSKDRISWELEKLINSKYLTKGIDYLIEANIAPYLLEFKNGIYLVKEKNIKSLNWEEFLMLCFYNSLDNLVNYNFKTELSSKIRTAITLAKDNPKNEYSIQLLFEYGLEMILTANRLNHLVNAAKDLSEDITSLYNKLPIYKTSDLAIKGQDIIDIVDNKNIGDILKNIQKLVLTGKLINEKQSILKYIKKRY